MSNQLQITGGAKVRNLEGVITGTVGVLSSVPLGAANGVATLDSGGKVPVSQLPASVVTYLGTWNAATNTPTLTNGVGDPGDLYICNVAGTVNFGAGPISFAVGDWVIYGSGTWQKSSGQNGTVTSVAASINGNAIGLTGSPITTAGTLAFAFAGNSSQYINGAGNLTTFPSIVPPTRTLSINGVSYDLSANRSWSIASGGSAGQILAKNSGTDYDWSWIDNYANWTEQLRDTVKASVVIAKGQAVYISGANGTNQLVSLADNSTEATSSKTLGLAMQNFAVNDIGQIITEGLLGGLNTSTATAGDPVWLGTNGNLIFGLANKPAAPAHLVYIGVVTRVNVNNGEIYVKIQNGFELQELHNVSITSPANGNILQYDSAISLWKNVAGTTTNIAEGTNLYFTNARAQNAITLTTTGTSGAATYTGGTLNIPQYQAAGTYVTSVTGTSPIVSSGGTTPAISITQATTSTNGYLSSTDWNTFNGKQAQLNGTGFVKASGTTISYDNSTYLTTSAAASTYVPYSGANNNVVLGSYDLNARLLTSDGTAALSGGVYLKQYTSSQDASSGYSSMAAFGGYTMYYSLNNGTLNRRFKINAYYLDGTTIRNYYLPNTDGTFALTSDLTGGTVTSVGLSSATSGVTIGSSPVTTSGTITLAIATASGSQQGLLSSTDWTTFNNKQNALTNPVTGTGTTNYLPKFTGTSTIGNSNLINDASGNLGLGVTPSAWGSGYSAFQIGGYGMLWANTSGSDMQIGSNAYYNGTNYIYKATDYASRYLQYNSQHIWFNAPSGTAGSAISFTQAMTLFSDGNLGLGTTTNAGYKLDVNGTGRFSGNLTVQSGYIQVNGSSNGYLNLNAANAGGNEAGIFYQIGGTNKWENYTAANDAALNWYSYGTGIVFKLASTGAATFSSSVTAGGYINTSGGFKTYNNGYREILFAASNGNTRWDLYSYGADETGANAGGNLYLARYNDDGSYLGQVFSITRATGALSYTGAATFSSSVTAGGTFYATVSGAGLDVTSGGTNSSYLKTSNTGGSFFFGLDNNGGASFGGAAYSGNLYMSGNYPMLFWTNATERMRITSDGKLLLNTTTANSYILNVNGSASFGSVYVGSLGSGTVYSNGGTLTNTNPSDQRLKTNIAPITYGLNEILQLNPVTFNWKEDRTKQGKQYGFIAQQVQQIMPDLVKPLGVGDLLGLDKEGIYATMVNAIKELKAEIETLKNKIK